MAPCTSCQEELSETAKFCASCGTKVVVNPTCSSCAEPLAPNAKFCGNCGTPAAGSPPPVVVVVDAAPPTAEEEKSTPATPVPETMAPASAPATPRPEPATPSAPPTSSRPVSVAVDAAAGARDRTDTQGSVSSHASTKKPVFAVKESIKCASCGKAVYKMEEALDSINTVYHKECLRCKVCKTTLTGRMKTLEATRPPGAQALTKGMFLVAKEGSELGAAGEFFCEKHYIKAGADVVKAQDIEVKARNDGELTRVASMRKEANDNARYSLQLTAGDSNPNCAICGWPIDKSQQMITSGLQRIHAACPSREEQERIPRNCRFFVRRSPDRLVVSLTCEEDRTKNPHTFLFEITRSSLEDSLRKKANEHMFVTYHPDANSRASAQRKLQVPESGQEVFDVALKTEAKDSGMHFLFKNPKENDRLVLPKPDPVKKELRVVKWYHSNAVLQTLTAVFKYDDQTKIATPESIELAYEMWPPEVAAEIAKDLDPLAELKKMKTENQEAILAAASSAGGVVEMKTEEKQTSAPTQSAPAGAAIGDAKPAAAANGGGGGGCCVVS